MSVRTYSPEFTFAADGFVVLDSELRVIAMNRTAERLFGPIAGEPMPCGELFGCHDADGNGLHDSANCVGRRVLVEQQAEPYAEMNLRTKAGLTIPVSISYSHIPQPEGGSHILMVIRDVSEKRKLESDLQAQVQQLATLQERERLAREFHDGLAQTLAYLNIQASQLEQALARDDTETARFHLHEMRLVIQSAYRDVRHALYDLRVTLDDGLGPALKAYCESFAVRNNLHMHYSGAASGHGCLNPEQAAQVLRIVQEALTNVRKHSRASDVWVELTVGATELSVTVRDNGVGFVVDASGLAKEKPHHYGLRTMQERAAGIGGSLQVQSEPGAGTELTVRVPCSPS